MFRGRGGFLLLLILVALALIAILVIRRGGGFPRLLGPRSEEPVVPLDLQTLIPNGWDVQAEQQLACDFDGDADQERLLIYRYNPTRIQKPLEKAGEFAEFAPFGGVIYDTQTSTLEPQPNAPGAYRPSNLVPYLLLPDNYPGKGEGYLGETSVDIRYHGAAVAGADCKTSEINIFGYSGSALPTRLSLFRWEGREAGYQGQHFAGSARVESNVTAEDGAQITWVTTYNRLENHRSVLCEVNRYTRPNVNLLSFISDAEVRTIDFCFEAPSEPVYPEGVVVALLRGGNKGSGQPSAYLLADAELSEGLNLGEENRKPINILSVGNPSWVTPLASDGQWCLQSQVGAPVVTPTPRPTGAPTLSSTPSPSGALWCGRERVRIETRIMLDGVARKVGWSLISVRPDRPDANVYWRIQKVDLE